MSRIALTAACLVLALALAAPARAGAQDASSAAQLFREAEEAFGRDDYLEALRLFRAAYADEPHPTVRFHVAMCLERLGRLREAWTELSEVAATPGLTEAQRRDAQRQVDRVRAQLATLRVEGEPAGASVRVDDAPMCTLPCEVPIEPGDHEVSIEDGTGRASTHVVGLRGGTVAVHLAIAPDPASPSVPEPVPEPEPEPSVGWLLVTGSIVTAVGVAGVTGFGLHAQSLHDAWLDDPTASLRDEGILFRDLTNASIAVLGVGAVMVVLDLVLAAAGQGTGDRAALDPVVRF